MKNKLMGDSIQITGIIAVIIGIAYEIIVKAPFGFLIITVGSLAFAIGTKIKHRRSKKHGK